MKQYAPASVWKNWVHFLAFGLGAGTSRIAPATCGTLVGVVIYFLIRWLPLPLYLLLVVALFVAGVWLCEVTAKQLQVKTHPGIVFDKIVGYLVAMTALPLTWKWALLGFVLFRLVDLYKPWPIKKIENKMTGGLALMLDSLIPAVYVLIVLQIFSWLMGVALPAL